MTSDKRATGAAHARDGAAEPGAAEPDAARRAMLRGGVVLGVVGVGAALSRLGEGTVGAMANAAAQGPAPARSAGPAATGAAKKKLGAASKVPVGGGVVYEKAKVVVTQPTAGDFKAFSGTCTHQTCLLADVSEGSINCACHGAKFSMVDGSAQKFPATEPLSPRNVEVEDGTLYLR